MPAKLPSLRVAAVLGSVHEIRWRSARSASNAPVTPDRVYLDWAGQSCTGMMEERQMPSRLFYGKVGTFDA